MRSHNTTLFRKALRSKSEREALSHLSQVLDDEVSGAAKELTLFFRSQQENVDRDALLTILNTGVIPPQVRNQIYGAHSDFWRDHLWEWVGDAGLAGEAYTGLNLEESAFTGYLDERGKEWATLMTTGQFAAYREVRDVCREALVPQDDALDLMVLATGHAKPNARFFALQYVAAHEEIKKAIGATLIRTAAQVLGIRATRTAEYELARAYNEAKQLAWFLAERLGLKAQVYKTWVTAEEPGPDSRVCPLCTALSRKRVPVRDEFEPGISSAPRHIRCRCSVLMGEKG